MPPQAKHLAGGDFCAHLKASTRVLDVSGREPVYRWESRNLTDFFRHAHNLDLLAWRYWEPPEQDGDSSSDEEIYVDGWNGQFWI